MEDCYRRTGDRRRMSTASRRANGTSSGSATMQAGSGVSQGPQVRRAKGACDPFPGEAFQPDTVTTIKTTRRKRLHGSGSGPRVRATTTSWRIGILRLSPMSGRGGHGPAPDRWGGCGSEGREFWGIFSNSTKKEVYDA